LTELAFSQLPKPTKRRATIENLIERFLEAGHVDEDIRNAIVAGDVTWTDGALTYAISQSRRKTEPSPEEVDQLVEEAFRFLDQSVFRKDPARPVSNAIVEEALKRKTPQQLGESESVTRSLLRSIAAKVAVSK
jgi:anti-sigma factor RsiW